LRSIFYILVSAPSVNSCGRHCFSGQLMGRQPLGRQ
jgi:hypothetical protein